MDIREQIIQKVMETLEGQVEPETADLVQDVLVLELNRYEVQERCTDVSVSDSSAERMLKKFFTTRRIETRTDTEEALFLEKPGDGGIILIHDRECQEKLK